MALFKKIMDAFLQRDSITVAFNHKRAEIPETLPLQERFAIASYDDLLNRAHKLLVEAKDAAHTVAELAKISHTSENAQNNYRHAIVVAELARRHLEDVDDDLKALEKEARGTPTPFYERLRQAKLEGGAQAEYAEIILDKSEQIERDIAAFKATPKPHIFLSSFKK